ncbi:histidine phosphatase family protein [Brachybacterium hainanense]|uniref:Histidine phosphatase family protein n=1 Tax=Brachybacterium hainanense TaxID=1541174 RepID=A0ABV6RCM4_9MICO
MDKDVLRTSPVSRRTSLAAAGGLGLAAVGAFAAPAGADPGKGKGKGQGNGNGHGKGHGKGHGRRGAVTLLVTRHGRTMLNTLDRVQGYADSPLTEPGVAIARQLGTGLGREDVEIDAVHCADMVRHFQTASSVIETHGSDLTPTRDARLREINFGSYEGEKNGVYWTKIANSLGYGSQEELMSSPDFDMPTALDAGAALSDGTEVPAETSAECADRALKALHDIAEAQASDGGGTVLVVTSGLTIYLALDALGADLSSVTSGFHNASVSTLTYEDGEWSIGTVNDMSYVEAGA